MLTSIRKQRSKAQKMTLYTVSLYKIPNIETSMQSCAGIQQQRPTPNSSIIEKRRGTKLSVFHCWRDWGSEGEAAFSQWWERREAHQNHVSVFLFVRHYWCGRGQASTEQVVKGFLVIQSWNDIWVVTTNRAQSKAQTLCMT